jgi:CHAT domain-containing protein/tetratricopeptide (TPR) repeat protein
MTKRVEILAKVSRHGLIFLLSAILLSESVAATQRNQKLQIAQPPENTQQNATRAAAEKLTQEGFKLFQKGTAESLRQAREKWLQALKLWQQIDDKTWQAITLVGIGRVYDSLGEKQEALKYLNQALPLTRVVEDRGGEAITLNNIGGVYDSLGEKQEALKYYNQALPLFRAVRNRGGEATTLNNIGGVYDSLGEKQEALKYYNQALPLLRAVGDRRIEAVTLNNIGLVYAYLGEKQEALKYYNQALPLSRTVENRAGEAMILNNIGGVYADLGEKQEALKYYNQALPLYRAVGDRGGEATTLNNIGRIYDSLGEKQEALKHLNQALPLFRAVEDKDGEASTLNNIGLVYDDLGEKQEALKYYNQALPLLRAVGDRGGEATTLNNIGSVYADLGEKQEALKYLNQALPLRRAVGDRGGEAATLNNIGTVYDDLGEKQEALKYYNQALPLRRAVGDRGGEAATLSNLAVLERDRGNLEQARTHIQAAIDIIEDLRTKIDDQQLRTSYFASVQNYYKFYTDLLMQLHKKDPSKGYDALALHISERSRARSLVELLTEARAGIRKDVDPKLLAEEQRLLQLIDAREKQRFEIVNGRKIQELPYKNLADKLQTEINDLLKEHKQLQTQIRTTSPKYADLVYPQPLTLTQIQQQLDKDTLLLQYSLGEERSYLWAVTPDSFHSYELPKGADIAAAAEAFHKLLQQPGNSLTTPRGLIATPTGERGARNIETALQLSQMILSPVADKLGKKRLVVVADGALQVIPFAALPDLNHTAPEDEVNYQPLLINHEVVHLPSMTALATQRTALKGRKSAPKTLAVLADPVFSANDQRLQAKNLNPQDDLKSSLDQSALGRAARNLNRGVWDRLPGTRQEAQAILQLVSPQSSLQAFDFNANFNWATKPDLSQYRYVHFATHGFADPKNPELSGIVLSLFNQAGEAKRGYLRLGDIFNLNLPADLVVLSACETGLGGNVSGEGLVGLTRGLMYAGAERLAVSLWKVDDKATAELMQKFYQRMLQNGEAPNVALHQAQLQMWNADNRRNPYFWSGFIVQGEWR